MSQNLIIPDSSFIPHPSSLGSALPEPRVAINVRVATQDDLPFIDSLQKKHSKMVGFMPRQSLEQKIGRGNVLVARASSPCDAESDTGWKPVLLGYCIGHDQYFKRDDVGIIYQLNVLPGKQRHLIGATLLKAMFDRAAYGCRLFCCWCAQDIAANYFWESMGFVPLAFRSGGRGRGQTSEVRGQTGSARVHIFWQKRIRAGDETTPWWFPSQTTGGSIREDRLVLPIPPGMRWSDEMPVILPGSKDEGGRLRDESARKQLPGPKRRSPPERTKYGISGSRLHFGLPEAAKEKPEPQKRQAMKNNPKLVAAARELRDRWLERVNSGEYLVEAVGKYDLNRLPPGRRKVLTESHLPCRAA